MFEQIRAIWHEGLEWECMIEHAHNKARMILILLGGVIMLGGLGVRLAFLHLGPNAELENRILGLRQTQRTLQAQRGAILDRNGNVLAMDLITRDVWIDPLAIQRYGHADFIAAQLARLLQVDPAFIRTRMDWQREYAMVRPRVSTDLADQIARMQMQGVHFHDKLTRYYMHGSLMSHVLGFVNWEGVGSAGIEQRFHSTLEGIPGLRVSELDGRRRELYTRINLEIPPRPGHTVQLTLDQNLQYMLEEGLDWGLEEFGGEAAWAIMMRVRTGEILAMASRPDYDLNDFRHSGKEERRNRAISENYEPGSTFKVSVLAAAFNEGIISPDNIIDCENGRWYFMGRPLHDYTPHGRLTVADVLQKSSNIGTAKIALMLPPEKFDSYLRDFGFGRRTGIELPGEEAGILGPRSQWSGLSVTRISMGHEVAVTALQQLNAVNAIANDGFLLRPYIVKRIVDEDGDVIQETSPEVVGRPIRRDTAALMTDLMVRVMEQGGTGRRGAMPDYSIAGKTGTAQKPIPGGYSNRENIASFVGFLPAEDPQISMIVVVDAPYPTRTGGGVAAPIFRRVAEDVVRYLDIPSRSGMADAGSLR